jgi:2-polyprenyl-6-methoxyphenol hydroxylase-like FAD-dependent oxidoreductase
MDDVVVVGAGPTGLTAAIELARRGVAVRVLDAATEPHRGSRGKGMQPRTLELLDAMGVADRLVSLGEFELPIRRREADGSVVDVDMNPDGVPTPTKPWARSLIIPQWRTEQVLRERLAEEGVPIEYGRRVTGLSQDTGEVTLTLDDGATLRSSWVVGADGGSSTVRHQLGVGFLGETHEQVRLMLGDVELEGLDRDHWHMWSSPGPLLGTGAVYFALCPLPASPTWQVQIGHTDPDKHSSEELLRELIDQLGPRIRVRRVETVGDWRLNVRMVDEYRVGRVFLAGDAAHVHSPAGGQGMNTGISDAVNLGWKLAAVVAGRAGDELLDSYTAERLPVAAGVLGLSGELTGRQFWQRTPEQLQDTMGFSTTYREGPDDGSGPQPGDRAPNAPLVVDGSATDLFAVRRRTDWTVLAFGGSSDVKVPELPGTVQVLDADAVAADNVLREAYGASDGDVVVIRPDGYVASPREY